MLARLSPNAEDAYALVREVRLRHDGDEPALATIAVADSVPDHSDVRDRAIESGFDDCIFGPVDHVRLVQVLERAAQHMKQSIERAKAAQTKTKEQAELRNRTRERRRKLAEERTSMAKQRQDVAQRLKSSYAATLEPEPDNLILASLPADDAGRIAEQFELVALPQGRVLLEAGEQFSSVYFLRSGLASRVVVMADGTTVETAVVGRDGMVGAQAALGAETTSYRLVMQIRGVGFKMPVAAFKEEFARGEAFQRSVLRYVGALDMQQARLSACNRLHSAEQRLARWLLIANELTDAGELPLTQELLSGVLGLRRVGVTLAAGALKKNGLIDYSWGQLRILRPKDLEARACECYSALRSYLVQ